MAQALNAQKDSISVATINPIKFWCLKQYLKSYQEEFANAAVDIEVCSIEDLLEQEMNNSIFSKHAGILEENLKIICEKNCDKKILIAFKDGFSLFLLASQSGYFLDTNIFPVGGKIVNLAQSDKVKTARSGFQKSNDFFMMLSPCSANSTMLAILDRWMSNPGLARLGVFKIKEGVPFFDKRNVIDDSMGVQKKSYKSYVLERVNWGLFYWTDEYINPKDYKNYLKYSNINLQIANPKSMAFLEPCSLC